MHNPVEMTMTIAQTKMVYAKWQQLEDKKLTFDKFLDGVAPTLGCNGAVAVYWAGMWLCIEKDGYCHT
jgi:hypothetical protein